jgi:hypothetical protein
MQLFKFRERGYVMKTGIKNPLFISLIMIAIPFFVIAGFSAMVRAEGSSETGSNQTLKSDTILYVDIIDHTGENFTWTGSGSIDVFAPDETSIGNYSSGSTITPTMNGAYRIQLNEDQSGAWDISVISGGSPVNGRMYSKEWHLDGGGYSQSTAMDNSFFALVPAGNGNNSVVEIKNEGLAGFDYKIGGSQNGITGSHACKSVPITGHSFDADIPIYLNIPSIATFSSLQPTVTNFDAVTNGKGDYQFSFETDIGGTYHIILDADADGFMDISGSNDVILSGIAAVGANEINWDGLDNFGLPVPEETYDTIVRIHTGEIHVLAEDVETFYPGLRLFSVSGGGSRTPLNMFWNDGLVQGGAVLMPNGQYGLETSGPAGLNPGNYVDSADANINARAWGNFTDAGKGNEAIMDTFTWINEDVSVVELLTIEEAADPVPACEGDSEPDGDVDGVDLVEEINAGGSNIAQFAADFGRTDCRL